MVKILHLFLFNIQFEHRSVVMCIWCRTTVSYDTHVYYSFFMFNFNHHSLWQNKWTCSIEVDPRAYETVTLLITSNYTLVHCWHPGWKHNHPILRRSAHILKSISTCKVYGYIIYVEGKSPLRAEYYFYLCIWHPKVLSQNTMNEVVKHMCKLRFVERCIIMQLLHHLAFLCI